MQPAGILGRGKPEMIFLAEHGCHHHEDDHRPEGPSVNRTVTVITTGTATPLRSVGR